MPLRARLLVVLAVAMVAACSGGGAADQLPGPIAHVGVDFDRVVGGARVVAAWRAGSYACVAVKSELPGLDRRDGWVGGDCNRFSSPDEIVAPAIKIVQVRAGAWVVVVVDSEGSLRSATTWTEEGITRTFGPIEDGRVIAVSVEGGLSCVEVTSRRYAKVQAWPAFDGSDHRELGMEACPPYKR